MKPRRKAIGKEYHNERFLVSLELNLEDLYALQSWVPYSDLFRRDLQEGIDWIEHQKELLKECGGV